MGRLLRKEVDFTLVYVISKHGKPLMPCKPQKARRLLKEQKAKVVKRTPFTIQLLYGSSGYKQDVILGVDAGSKTIGVSASTENKEVFDEVEYQGEPCFIFGRRNSGYFDIRKLDGTKVNASASYKKLKLLSKTTSLLCERRQVASSPQLNQGVSAD